MRHRLMSLELLRKPYLARMRAADDQAHEVQIAYLSPIGCARLAIVTGSLVQSLRVNMRIGRISSKKRISKNMRVLWFPYPLKRIPQPDPLGGITWVKNYT